MSKLWLLSMTLLCAFIACDGGDDDGGGSAGSGGSSGAAGAATAGAAGATAGAAGTGNSGGSAGSSMNPSGGSGGLVIPLPTGTIGAGVACTQDMPCAAGTACCRESSGASCVSSFADCDCSLSGKCLVMGCDSAEDCPGGHCCALLNPRQSPTYHATSCKPECESGERRLCVVDADCRSGDSCQHGTSFDWCF